jgi:hypothetical protein
MTLADALAPRIAPVLLANLSARYPYHDGHVFESGDPPHDPFAAHPAFGNSFDWHSSVHSHWTALELARRGNSELSAAIARNLTVENVAAETGYLRRRASYERPYGWAWALLLAASAAGSSVVSRPCADALGSMAEVIGEAALSWLKALPMPVRHGVHSNSAFAMSLMHEASGALALVRLKSAIERRASEWFGDDRSWPETYERSGNDFLSPACAQADLMRRVLSGAEFRAWWKAFVPNLMPTSPVLAEAVVPNVPDGQIVHLHGLNLSRAAALARIARTLDDSLLLESARRLFDASVDRAVNGHYSEVHWLPTFAWIAACAIDEAQRRAGLSR